MREVRGSMLDDLSESIHLDSDQTAIDRCLYGATEEWEENLYLYSEVSSPDTSEPYFLDLINRIDEITEN